MNADHSYTNTIQASMDLDKVRYYRKSGKERGSWTLKQPSKASASNKEVMRKGHLKIAGNLAVIVQKKNGQKADSRFDVQLGCSSSVPVLPYVTSCSASDTSGPCFYLCTSPSFLQRGPDGVP